jgi:hypothetical protein
MRKYRMTLLVARKLEGPPIEIVTMIRTMKLSITDFKIGFFVGILSKKRSRK